MVPAFRCSPQVGKGAWRASITFNIAAAHRFLETHASASGSRSTSCVNEAPNQRALNRHGALASCSWRGVPHCASNTDCDAGRPSVLCKQHPIPLEEHLFSFICEDDALYYNIDLELMDILKQFRDNLFENDTFLPDPLHLNELREAYGFQMHQQ
jgi:hypothetical protein